MLLFEDREKPNYTEKKPLKARTKAKHKLGTQNNDAISGIEPGHISQVRRVLLPLPARVNRILLRQSIGSAVLVLLEVPLSSPPHFELFSS